MVFDAQDGLPPCDGTMQDAAMHPDPGAFMVIALIVAVTIALTVRSRRKRTAALAAQWQAFQQH
ncbi:hypothetical protein [Streptomyces sp. BK239]|uniref:hypothetical protein n=1 Tax=Streptomyces sp. BK239 TaxID=2512155 RepID=UPI00102BB303|nr:hypothetical protein [Streptomyces sp. BK239]